MACIIWHLELQWKFVLRRIDNKLIKYENIFSPKKRTLLSKTEVKYVQDVIFARDTVDIGMSRKEVIQVILGI